MNRFSVAEVRPCVVSFAGVIGGTVLGSAANLWKNFSLSAKDKQVCKIAFDHFPLLKTINTFKQFEIKNCSFITPFIPLVGSVLYNTFSERNSSEGLRGIPNEFARQVAKVPGKKLALSATLVGLTMAANSLLPLLCRDGFDPSGHLMLKTTLSICLMDSIECVSAIGGRKQAKWATLFAAVVAGTDMVLLYNATGNCHTIAEVAAGVGVTALLYPLAQSLVNVAY